MRRTDTEVLVVGRGMAGLLAAFHAAKAGASVVVTGTGGGASSWLQGVNVPLGHADPRDTPEILYQDILREGYGLSDPALARDTAEGAIEVFNELTELGVEFARDGDRFRQRHASGSTYPRCCFVPGMMWGPRAKQVLRQRLEAMPNVRFEPIIIARLLVDDAGVAGAAAYDPKTSDPVVIGARSVVLAAGGIGALFAHSTYPPDVWGASYALAYHAGACLKGMEFIQFEPLVVHAPERLRGYVIPTTLFGDGAFLTDAQGVRFLLEFRPQGEAGIGKEELVLAMAEMARQRRAARSGAVRLDARAVPLATLKGYPWLYDFLLKHGIDLSRETIEVLPAAHTCLGGIEVDVDRQTCVAGLFAAGEAAAGVHGAGRLAGGSGTDVIVSGARAGDAAARAAQRPRSEALMDLFRAECGTCEPAVERMELLESVRRRARAVLSEAAGIWRDGPTLSKALDEIAELYWRIRPATPVTPASQQLRLADMLLVSGMVLASAMAREESRGAHQRTDFPETNPDFAFLRPLPWPPGSPFSTAPATRAASRSDDRAGQGVQPDDAASASPRPERAHLSGGQEQLGNPREEYRCNAPS